MGLYEKPFLDKGKFRLMGFFSERLYIDHITLQAAKTSTAGKERIKAKHGQEVPVYKLMGV